ncbi:MAG: DUF748 domain-containing protein, partial [Thermodesulfovibrionales bacterium]|nr:DUF748 domain-containing protein [Thermodesulfovibrionales bacterium]
TKTNQKKDEKSDGLKFSINNIGIHGGKVVFDDRPQKITHNLSDVEIKLPFISNMPHFQETNIKPSFKAKVNDKPIVIEGSSKPFSKSVETDFSLNIKNLDIPFYMTYLPQRPKFIVDKGTFASDIKIKYIQYQDKEPSLKIKGLLSVSDFILSDLQKNKLVEIKKTDVTIGDSDVIAGFFQIQGILVDSPDVNLLLDENGDINITKILPKKEGDSKKVAFEIGNVNLIKGGINFHDKKNGFKKRFLDIDIKATNISNRKDVTGIVSASIVSDAGERLSIDAKVNIDTLTIEADTKFYGLALKGYSPYYNKHLNAIIKTGSADISGKFIYTPEKMVVSDISASLMSFLLLDKDGGETIKIPYLKTSDGYIDIIKKDIRIGNVEGKDARINVIKDENGTFNLTGITKDKQGQDDKENDDKKWSYSIATVILNGFALKYSDESVSTPVEVSLKKISLNAKNIGNKRQQKGRINIMAIASDKGKISADASLMINPLNLEGLIRLNSLDLTTLKGYLYEHLNVLMPQGNLTVDGRLSFKSEDDNPILSYKGMVSFRQIHLIDKNTSEDILKLGNLHINNLSVINNPFSLSANDISLTDFYSRLSISKDKRLNLQDVVVERQSTGTVQTDTTTQKGQKTIQIGAITLQNGAIYFTDRHVDPNFSAKLTRLGGAISGLTSQEDKTAEIDIRGMYEDYAPLNITGRVNPFKEDLYLELKADFKNMDIPVLNPYSTRYVGYTIDKGKLSFEVKYFIDKGGLDAENNILFDQLTLGEKVESPDATKLPVKLAIALLKDNTGAIKLDLPVKGSLKDPEFSIGKIVIKMFVNLLLKVATSPFSLLGAMFGGSEEISYIEFDYGSSEIRQDQIKKIEILIKALKERPSLNLSIKGLSDMQKDKEGMKRIVFEQKLKSQKLKEIIDKGMPAISLKNINIEPTEYERYLTLVYKSEPFAKPKNFLGILKKLPPDEMQKLILSHIQISESDLRQLANDRASAVLRIMKSTEGIGADRLFMLEGSVSNEDAEKKSLNRVDFILK